MSTHFCHLNIREQVQRAQALAESAITTGLQGHAATGPENDPTEMACALAGCQDWLAAAVENDAKADLMTVSDLIAAARAIGIAQGLRLRSELFTKGGTK
jgi:hypothetical protein